MGKEAGEKMKGGEKKSQPFFIYFLKNNKKN